MSGAEAGFVIGLIGSLISIIDAAKKIYDAARDANGQPEAFRQVAARLPLVIEILRSAEKRASSLDETALAAIEETLESCKAKAENLKKIFHKVVRKDDDKWLDRYKKALKTWTKGDIVEGLMEGILKDTQLLACEKLRGIATEAQVKELDEGIKEMKEMPLSLQEETGTVTQNHEGSGNNNANTGRGAMHTGTGDLYQNEIKGDAHFGSNPGQQVINYYNLPQDTCLKDLRITDPRMDKERIEKTNGGLLKDSYGWILENSEFLRWHENKQSRLLWIRGDPGKGKTMLLCGIIDKLKEAAGAASASSGCLLTYFFCQATDSRINSATAVLRGLIYLLADEQPALLKHVQKEYDNAGRELFVDANSWFALSKIFTNILQGPGFESACVVIDALDECVTDLPLLLQFIDNTSSASPRVKWIISSRNWPKIEEEVNKLEQKVQLRLELNEDSIAAAVRTYIKLKVAELANWKKYNAKLANSVQNILLKNADATFLWVALALQELKKTDRRKALKMVEAFPPGLDPLYTRMMAQVSESEDADLCKRILSIVMVVKRPITLRELVSLDDTLHKLDSPEDLEDLEQTVGQCGSFLTIRNGTIYFVHQSAKDFLIQKNTSQKLFRSEIDEIHHTIFSRSLQVMSVALQRDVYGLRAPGISIDQVEPPSPDPLAPIRYSCLYWVDYLLECQRRQDTIKDLQDSGLLYSFLHQYFLYWLEALSLLKSVSEGVVMIRKLEDLQFDGSPILYEFIHDARRFAVYNRSIIELAPLQAYVSALLFAPEKSIIRQTFEEFIPSWIQRKPRVEIHWNAMLQALEGHSSSVKSVAFSPDGKQVVSGSWDQTVRLWDAVTGAALQTLEGHSGYVSSVAFSPDGKQVVSGSWDQTVRLWDAVTGAALQTLKGHSSYVNSVAFSPDGKQVVSGSRDQTVRLWDAVTGAALQTLKGHSSYVNSVAFSPDGKQVVSGSGDKTALQTLEGHSGSVTSVAFSTDGKLLPTLHVRNDWLLDGITNVLWLPTDYRPTCEAIWDEMIILGQSTGRISFLQIKKGPKLII